MNSGSIPDQASNPSLARRLATGALVGAAIAVACAAPMWRALGVGLRPVDSYNSVWMSGFVAALERGEWPPRWLPEAFEGMGASSFYFYPPLAFWFGAAVDAVWPGPMTAEMLTAWACLAMSLCGSAGMYLWLRGFTGRGVSLVAACAYAWTPYFLIDLFARGSLGELAAHAVLPFLALGLQAAARSWRGVAGLAAAYAGLVLAHIAVAVTVTAFALPVWAGLALWRAPPRHRPGLLLRLIAGGVLGLALAAHYLAPALSLQDAASMKWMWWPHLSADPASWTLFNWAAWPSRPLADAFAWLGWTYGGAALVALLILWRAGGERARAARTWSLIVLVAIAAYAFPAVWHTPLQPMLGKVQFPFRMLVVVEFAVVTAVALSLTRKGWWRGLAFMAVAAGLWFPAVRMAWPMRAAALAYPTNADATIAERIRHGRAPEEHLPADFNFDPKIVRQRVLLDGFDGLPAIMPRGPGVTVLAASEYPDGSLAASIAAERPALVAARRFHFPAWRASLVQPGDDPSLPVRACGVSRFACFEVRPGRHLYRLHIVRTPVERLGDGITLAAIALTLGLVIHSAARRRAWRGPR